MLATNRVIWKDDSTLRDLSNKLNNQFSETQVIDYVSADDKLFIGSDVPFNHRYFMVSSANSAASTLTVEFWDGNEWVAAIDVLDDTASTPGTPFGRSGIISWSTPRNKGWVKEDSTEDMTDSGVQTLKIYNMYWVRISFGSDLTSTTALKYIGHKFSKDEDLEGYYPDLNRSNVQTAFKAGKTNWDEQHILAAEEIFRDLRTKRELWAKGQIFEWEAFNAAAVHKVAQIVYSSFGEEYEERRNEAYERYSEALDGSLSRGIDKDSDGHIDSDEHGGFSVGLFRR